jgi:hypothetical protein
MRVKSYAPKIIVIDIEFCTQKLNGRMFVHCKIRERNHEHQSAEKQNHSDKAEFPNFMQGYFLHQ